MFLVYEHSFQIHNFNVDVIFMYEHIVFLALSIETIEPLGTKFGCHERGKRGETNKLQMFRDH